MMVMSMITTPMITLSPYHTPHSRNHPHSDHHGGLQTLQVVHPSCFSLSHGVAVWCDLSSDLFWNQPSDKAAWTADIFSYLCAYISANEMHNMRTMHWSVYCEALAEPELTWMKLYENECVNYKSKNRPFQHPHDA